MDGASEFFKHYNDPDKDHRYMAVSDLLTDVQKPAWKAPSGGDPNKLCEKVVECLSDNSGDISALAVKWYAVYTCPRLLSPCCTPEACMQASKLFIDGATLR